MVDAGYVAVWAAEMATRVEASISLFVIMLSLALQGISDRWRDQAILSTARAALSVIISVQFKNTSAPLLHTCCFILNILVSYIRRKLLVYSIMNAIQ